jgi:deoxynucleotide monophosphate kinase-like protein
MTKKIGLAGKSGSGKDLIADYIEKQYGFQKIAVADGIREEINTYLQYTLAREAARQDFPPSFSLVLAAFKNAVWDKPTTPEIRIMLQWWGTEFRRSSDPDYWVKKLSVRLNNDDCIVISDVRTPDEMRVVRAAGGEVWFVERSGVDSVGIEDHYTEIALVGVEFDRRIKNDATVDHLKLQIDSMFAPVLVQKTHLI